MDRETFQGLRPGQRVLFACDALQGGGAGPVVASVPTGTRAVVASVVAMDKAWDLDPHGGELHVALVVHPGDDPACVYDKQGPSPALLWVGPYALDAA